MAINTRNDYIEIGTSVATDGTLEDLLILPVPNELPSSNEFIAEASRNAVGTLVLQQIGRTQYKTEITWSNLPSEKWWEINRWFDTNGYVFYMKYFNHNMGKIQVQRFYRGNIKSGTPSTVQKMIDGVSLPVSYLGVGFSIIDMGEDNVTVLKTF